jgi:hypothetical protein
VIHDDFFYLMQIQSVEGNGKQGAIVDVLTRNAFPRLDGTVMLNRYASEDLVMML